MIFVHNMNEKDRNIYLEIARSVNIDNLLCIISLIAREITPAHLWPISKTVVDIAKNKDPDKAPLKHFLDRRRFLCKL